MRRGNFRLSVKVTAGVLILVAIAGLFEALARGVYAYQEELRSNLVVSGFLQRSLILDPYEMPSPDGLYHWVLRPSYQADRRELIAQKQRAGRVLGTSALQSIDSKRERKTGLRINMDGFKGPDLDKSHARPRLLALGDSTTFGISDTSYPRHLESILNQRGVPIEVVNGGVEGYFPCNLIYEIERYKALKPEMVIIYIGWNSLFSNVPWEADWENILRGVWLYKRAKRTMMALFDDPHAYALRLYNRDLKPDSGSPEVRTLETFTPPFMGRIERLIDEFESIVTRVVLVTLPGLFTMSVNPSPRALKIGHLPYFTTNPFVLAKMTERFNTVLRALAERRGIGLVDLEKWSVQTLQPRDAFFSDSVHLTPKGLNMIGAFIADQLEGQILKSR